MHVVDVVDLAIVAGDDARQPMTLFVCWLIFPVVLASLSLGCGLLAERAAGVRIPGTLLLPVGFALMMIVTQLAVTTDATAELAAPLAVLLALAGIVLTRPWESPRPWESRRPDGWAVGAAAAVFAAFGAPVVLSGDATFAGYLKLDDTAIWFAITDHVMSHGRGLDSLDPSFYKTWLGSWLPHGYPIGTFLPLGVGRALVGQDVAWVFQPYLAFLAATLTLSLYELAGRVMPSRPLRAIAAFIAAQPAILFGYSLVGGVKEVLTAALLPPLAVLAISAVRTGVGPRGLLPLALLTAAVVVTVSYGAVFWLLPLLAAAILIAVRLDRVQPALRQAGILTAMTAVLSLPALPALADFISNSRVALTSESEFGSLVKPLSPLQPFGIWLSGDFRLNPHNLLITDILVVLVIAGAVGGLVYAWRQKAWDVIAYVGAIGVGCLVISGVGAPWVDAKAFAIASPVFLLAALVGAAFAAKFDVMATGLVGGLIAVGVVWSNVLAYHDVNLAPRDRFVDLQKVGERVDGEGPTLSLQYDLYDGAHFLRKGDPDGPLSTRLVSGGTPRQGTNLDIDEFRIDDVTKHPSLVLARSPTTSRPPSPYRLAWRGRFYDLWQRDGRAAPRVIHLPLGDPGKRRPIARPTCSNVLRLARRPGTRRLAAVTRPPQYVMNLNRLPHPDDWIGDKSDPGILRPFSPGTMSFQLRVPRSDRYRFWLGNGFRRRVELAIDGDQIAADNYQLQLENQFVPMGTATLRRGEHDVELSYGGSNLRPGTGVTTGIPVPFGPLVMTEATPERPVRVLRPDEARSLCGERLDWVEALGS